MSAAHHARGGAAVGTLKSLESWEANLVLNLRLWCEGAKGQKQVLAEYRSGLPHGQATAEFTAFVEFIRLVTSATYRPLVRHSVSCSCLGADEAVFANLVRAASDGHHRDAALIATLLVAPARAEDVARLAAKVGATVRKIHPDPQAFSPATTPNVVRLH